MTLTVYSARRRLGQITLDGKRLLGSTPALQNIADVTAQRAGGDVTKAYAALDGWTNGYLTIITAPAGQDAGPGTAAAFDPDEARDREGKWSKVGNVTAPKTGGYQTAERPALGPALHELAGSPDYDREFGYGSGFYGPAEPIRDLIDRVHGKPAAEVTVYRVGGEIQPGDWVSLSREYSHDLRPDQPVRTKTVPAGHLRLALSDWTDEFSYQPPEAQAAHRAEPSATATAEMPEPEAG